MQEHRILNSSFLSLLNTEDCDLFFVERGGSIITCDTKLWKRKASKPIKNNSISAFNVSADGKLLAM